MLCHCRDDGVQIDMRAYMQLYRPDECKDVCIIHKKIGYNTKILFSGKNIGIILLLLCEEQT